MSARCPVQGGGWLAVQFFFTEFRNFSECFFSHGFLMSELNIKGSYKENIDIFWVVSRYETDDHDMTGAVVPEFHRSLRG